MMKEITIQRNKAVSMYHLVKMRQLRRSMRVRSEESVKFEPGKLLGGTEEGARKGDHYERHLGEENDWNGRAIDFGKSTPQEAPAF
uniref:Uncharacterized protein n=1 Tax=Pristionchus pacificus TaxID=54126 RepID=A0A2A6BDN4_PRIPA|eukprot:PDM64010.1 hypothetical protein PRIPAC_49511 [Pristionchus pacificus]